MIKVIGDFDSLPERFSINTRKEFIPGEDGKEFTKCNLSINDRPARCRYYPIKASDDRGVALAAVVNKRLEELTKEFQSDKSFDDLLLFANGGYDTFHLARSADDIRHQMFLSSIGNWVSVRFTMKDYDLVDNDFEASICRFRQYVLEYKLIASEALVDLGTFNMA